MWNAKIVDVLPIKKIILCMALILNTICVKKWKSYGLIIIIHF